MIPFYALTLLAGAIAIYANLSTDKPACLLAIGSLVMAIGFFAGMSASGAPMAFFLVALFFLLLSGIMAWGYQYRNW